MKRLNLLVLVLCVLITGCADAKELDDVALVLSLGIDKGESAAYLFTFQLPYQNNESQVGENARFHSLTCEANTMEDAQKLINANSAYNLDLSHLNYLVFGRALGEQGINRLVRELVQRGNARQSAMVIMTDTTANEYIIGLESDKETNLERIQESILKEADSSGLFPRCTLSLLYDEIDRPFCDVLAARGAMRTEKAQADDSGAIARPPGDIPLSGSLGSNTLGAAAMRNGRVVGTLTGEQCRFLLIGRGVFESDYFQLPLSDGNGNMTVYVKTRRRPAIETTDKNGKVQARVTVYLAMQVISAPDIDRPGYTPQAYVPYLTDYFQRGIAQAEKECRAMGVDAFCVGRKLVLSKLTNKAWQAFNWPAQIKTMETEVRVDVRMHVTRPAFER
ncbi:MAG: hypothetical protein IJP30_03495 [Clostridia bacterium]|nr:hypothetical protein [Clostridia bacterium]